MINGAELIIQMARLRKMMSSSDTTDLQITIALRAISRYCQGTRNIRSRYGRYYFPGAVKQVLKYMNKMYNGKKSGLFQKQNSVTKTMNIKTEQSETQDPKLKPNTKKKQNALATSIQNLKQKATITIKQIKHESQETSDLNLDK